VWGFLLPRKFLLICWLIFSGKNVRDVASVDQHWKFHWQKKLPENIATGLSGQAVLPENIDLEGYRKNCQRILRAVPVARIFIYPLTKL
jgi:hypothetical protein